MTACYALLLREGKMKKKFIAILKKHGFELVKFEHSKPQFDWNNYDIEYKDADGYEYHFELATDIWDKDENSITNKVGILKYFEECVVANCAQR